jgi:DNA polymerase
MDSSVSLENFYEEVKDCKKCQLAYSRKNIVFGAGSAEARVVFVGEAPGYYEDQQGEPFVGAAGKLLSELLAGIGLERKDVYIGNVLKCRPPQNRNPLPEEIELCKPYLFKQLEIINPRVVCTLGNFATQTILARRVPISSVRAKPVQVGKFFVFPLYHPAAALHRGDMLEPLREDFRKLKEFLDSERKPEPEPEQLQLL